MIMDHDHELAAAAVISAAEFESGLRAHLVIEPNDRIQHILDMPDSRRRTRRMAAMEMRAREHVGVHGAIDWSKVDWASIFQMIVKLLSLFLAL